MSGNGAKAEEPKNQKWKPQRDDVLSTRPGWLEFPHEPNEKASLARPRFYPFPSTQDPEECEE